MQCQHAYELFSDYVGGQLDRPLMVTLDSHLEQCSSCREAVTGMRRVWSDLERLPAVEPPPYFHENLMHRINVELDSQEAATARRRGLWDWRALLRPRAMVATGGLALILLFTGAGFVHLQSAGMWPFSLVHAAAPALHVALEKPTAEWTQGDDGASRGTLTLHLQLDGATMATGSDVDYTVKIESAAPGAAGSAVGVFLPNGTATARIPLSAHPEAGRDTLVVAVKAQKDGVEGHQELRQPLDVRN